MAEVDFANPRFYGQAKVSIDPKTRIFFPSKWQDKIGDFVIIHKGLGRMGDGKYLELTTPEVFNELIERINTIPSTNRKYDQLISFIMGNAEEVKPDKQFRILIPKYLAEYAELDSDVTLVGQGKQLMIWNSKKYEIAESGYNHSAMCDDFDMLNQILQGDA